MGPKKLSGQCGEEKNLLSLLGLKPQVCSVPAGSSVTLWHNCLMFAELEVDVIYGNKQESDADPCIVLVDTLWPMWAGTVRLV
jgi:hypothetical protein